jgi:hypothetical protein
MNQDTTVRERADGEGAEAGIPATTGSADEEARVAEAIGQHVAQGGPSRATTSQPASIATAAPAAVSRSIVGLRREAPAGP